MTVTVPSLPEPVPTSTDPTNFDERADALLSALPAVVAAQNLQNVENNTLNAAVVLQAAAAAADRVQTGLDRAAAALSKTGSAADKVATAEDRAQTALDRTAAALSKTGTGADALATAADKVATAADRAQTGLDRTQTGLDRIAAALSKTGTASDLVQTALDRAAAALSKTGSAADVVVTGQDRAQTGQDRTQTGLDRTAANTSANTASTKAAEAAASAASIAGGPVASVAGLTGTIDALAIKTAISLDNVENTSDADKPVSTDQQTALNLKANSENPSYTGTLTGDAGVVNLGSGQFYKDDAGNVGIGTSAPTQKLSVAGVIESIAGGFKFPDSSVQNTAPSGFGFKNRIINGDMRIDQRNNGAATVAGGISGTYTLDRFLAYSSVASRFSVQRRLWDGPNDEFPYHLRVTSLSSGTVSSGYAAFYVAQAIELENLNDFNWSGNGQQDSMALSFWVRSSLIGSHGGTAMAAGVSNFVFSYDINAANVWEKKVITIPPNVGSSVADAGGAFKLQFSMGVGSYGHRTEGGWSSYTKYYSVTGAVQVIETNGATWDLTGLQLEKGVTDTHFDRRDYGRELIMCQRYCAKLKGTIVGDTVVAGGSARAYWFFPVTMRASPTVTPSTDFAWPNFARRDVTSGAPIFNDGTLADAEIYYVV